MGRKQVVVLEALSKARKPMSLSDLADKNLKGDGRDEVYGASDLRSTFRRLGARGHVTVTEEERTVGKGDDAKKSKVQVATITDAGRKALKDFKNPPAKTSTKKDAPAEAADTGSEGDAEAPAAEGGSEGDAESAGDEAPTV